MMCYAGLNFSFGCLQRGQRQSSGRSSKALWRAWIFSHASPAFDESWSWLYACIELSNWAIAVFTDSTWFVLNSKKLATRSKVSLLLLSLLWALALMSSSPLPRGRKSSFSYPLHFKLLLLNFVFWASLETAFARNNSNCIRLFARLIAVLTVQRYEVFLLLPNHLRRLLQILTSWIGYSL